jgi:hypothetical protein
VGVVKTRYKLLNGGEEQNVNEAGNSALEIIQAVEGRTAEAAQILSKWILRNPNPVQHRNLDSFRFRATRSGWLYHVSTQRPYETPTHDKGVLRIGIPAGNTSPRLTPSLRFALEQHQGYRYEVISGQELYLYAVSPDALNAKKGEIDISNLAGRANKPGYLTLPEVPAQSIKYAIGYHPGQSAEDIKLSYIYANKEPASRNKKK